MKCVGLNGKTYTIKLTRSIRHSSSLHEKARLILKNMFPHTLVYEEIQLPGTKMRVDFFLPELNLMVEVQGPQHDSYNKHFHKNKMGFLSSLKRDKNKQKWCELNNIQLVELRDGDWSEQIRQSITGSRE